MKHESHVAEYKKEVVKEILNLINQYHIIGAVNMENLPAPQLQNIRAQLRNDAVLLMTKRRIIKIAIEQIKDKKKGIEGLEQHLGGMPALLFTRQSPFKLSRMLQKNKSPAPAKAGQTAPRDIIVNKGPTSFAPGPVIGELAAVGIKSGVEGGKVAIKEDSVVAEKGDKIKPKVAEILTRLGIMPMEVGLDLVAIYENGTIYTKDVLSIDDKVYLDRLSDASRWAFNLAMYSAYPTKQTVLLLIGKAYNESKSLGRSAKIFEPEIVEELVSSAERQMLNLKNTANIPVEVHEKKSEEIKSEAEKEIGIEKKSEIEVLTREQLEANIKMRDEQKAIKDVEKIAHDISKKFAEGNK